MCKMLHFQNIIVWCDRVAYIMCVSVRIVQVHLHVCASSRVKSEVTSCHWALTETRYQRDIASPRHLQRFCVRTCACVSVWGIPLQRHLLTRPRQTAWMTHMEGSLEWTSGDETAAYVCGSHLLRLTIFFGAWMANTHAQLHRFDIRKVKLCSFSDGAVSQYQGQRKRELRKGGRNKRASQ